MEITLDSMFIRYLSERPQPWTREDKLLFTAGLFLNESDEFIELRMAHRASIDIELVDAVLYTASPIEVASFLRFHGLSLPVDTFWTHALRAAKLTNDFIPLAYLGGTMYSYARLHGLSAEIPAGLAETLLAANERFARIAGLKLTAMRPVDLDEFNEHLLRSLRRPNIEEQNAGLNMIIDVFYENFPQRMDLPTSSVWPRIVAELETLKSQGLDGHIREFSARILGKIAGS